MCHFFGKVFGLRRLLRINFLRMFGAALLFEFSRNPVRCVHPELMDVGTPVSRTNYLGGGSFGIASHFMRFASVDAPFFASHDRISSPTAVP